MYFSVFALAVIDLSRLSVALTQFCFGLDALLLFWKRAADNERVVDLEFKVGKTKITIKRVVVVEFL